MATRLATATVGAAIGSALVVYLFMRRKRKGDQLHDWVAHHAKALPNMTDADNAPLDKAAVHALRRSQFCAAQSVSYANVDPLLIVRGEVGAGPLRRRLHGCHPRLPAPR